MNIQAKKLSLIRWLSQLGDEAVLEKIERIRFGSFSGAEGSPMSLEEFLQRNLRSQQDITTGNLMAQDKAEEYFRQKHEGSKD